MEYYIVGNPGRALEIQKFFESKGYTVSKKTGTQHFEIYYTVEGLTNVRSCSVNTDTFDVIVRSEASYTEIKLPKFKKGDILQDVRFPKALPMVILDVVISKQYYTIRDSTGSEVCISFDCAHKYFEYFKESIKLPFKVGDLVLTRAHDQATWKVNLFSHLCDSSPYFACANSTWPQCIPLKGNEHLAGTAQQCDKCYPPICYGKKTND